MQKISNIFAKARAASLMSPTSRAVSIAKISEDESVQRTIQLPSITAPLENQRNSFIELWEEELDDQV